MDKCKALLDGSTQETYIFRIEVIKPLPTLTDMALSIGSVSFDPNIYNYALEFTSASPVSVGFTPTVSAATTAALYTFESVGDGEEARQGESGKEEVVIVSNATPLAGPDTRLLSQLILRGIVEFHSM